MRLRWKITCPVDLDFVRCYTGKGRERAFWFKHMRHHKRWWRRRWLRVVGPDAKNHVVEV